MPRSKKSYAEIDDIREDLDSLKSNVVALTKHVKKDGATQTQEIKNILSERWSDLQENGRAQYRTMEKTIKTKPGQSMAVAFAAGLAASLLLRRR